MRDLNLAKDLLAPALRQYRHNNSDEFVAGYDRNITIETVRNLVSLVRTLIDGYKIKDPIGLDYQCAHCFESAKPNGSIEHDSDCPVTEAYRLIEGEVT